MNKDKQGNAYKERKGYLKQKKRFFLDIINRLKLLRTAAILMRKQVIHSIKSKALFDKGCAFITYKI